jgi:flotillin
MRLKAEAFQKYGEAAILDLLVKVLPEVVTAASEPMKAIDKITVITTDGASSLTKTVASNVAQGLQLGSDLTGVDLAGLLAKLGQRGHSDNDDSRPTPAAIDD